MRLRGMSRRQFLQVAGMVGSMGVLAACVPAAAPSAAPAAEAGPLLVPAAAALPVIAALVIAWAGKTAAYPPGPRESVWKSPRPIEERADTH